VSSPGRAKGEYRSAQHEGNTVTFAGMLRRATLVAALSLAAAAASAADVPYLSGRVVDDADILSPAARERLTATSRAHEDKTTNQVVVLTVPTIGGESIEEYANRVFGTWKLGQKGKDNGVLLVVVPNDRKLRIEVGYGLEAVLPDVDAARIIRNQITPRFKAGDFDGGVTDGLEAIVARLEGRGGAIADGGGTTSASTAKGIFDSPEVSDFEDQLPPWPMRILLGAFIFGVIGLFTVIGVVTPGMGWFLYVFLIPFWAMFPIIVVGVRGALIILGIYVVGFPVAKLIMRSRPGYLKAAEELKRTGHATFGGMVITRGGSGSSSSGGSSGGGFSGGGGSSGGGGASGSW
jgi:uncharacterized protein